MSSSSVRGNIASGKLLFDPVDGTSNPHGHQYLHMAVERLSFTIQTCRRLDNLRLDSRRPFRHQVAPIFLPAMIAVARFFPPPDTANPSAADKPSVGLVFSHDSTAAYPTTSALPKDWDCAY